MRGAIYSAEVSTLFLREAIIKYSSKVEKNPADSLYPVDL